MMCWILFLLLTMSFVSSQSFDYVHVIFSNHLDVGFDDLAINVINKYFDNYFPFLVDLTQEFRDSGDRFIYTTHSWLVSLYIDCPPLPGLHCPTQDQIDQFSKTIRNGDITWHGFPFNGQFSWAADASLLESAIKIAQNLTEFFDLDPVKTVSQRDVPGLTSGVIPTLLDGGIAAISVGVNPYSAPPDVPPVFLWKPHNQDSEIIAMWHKGGYGGITYTDIPQIPGLNHTIVFVWGQDNAHPYNFTQVQELLQFISLEFPGATVAPSTIDNFVERLIPVKDKLPVITEEIEDTWVNGVASDPYKHQLIRELIRLRGTSILLGAFREEDFQAFDRIFIKGLEHTWGLRSQELNDWTNWENEDFQNAKRVNQNYTRMEQSWIEQRSFIEYAMTLLPPEFLKIVNNALNYLRPNLPDFELEYRLETDISIQLNCSRYSMWFGNESGLVHLYDHAKGQLLASPDNIMGQYIYTTYDSASYSEFLDEYLYCKLPFCENTEYDFGKPNLPPNIVAKTWYTTATNLWTSETQEYCSYYLESEFEEEAYLDYGAPRTVFMHVNISKAHFNYPIRIEYILVNKTQTRLPEAHWIGFSPFVRNYTQNYLIGKVGQKINPILSTTNSSLHIHGQFDGVHFNGSSISMIRSLDAGILSLGSPNIFPIPLNKVVNQKDPIYFNLMNNIWGTNWILWYPFQPADSSIKFRFTVHLVPPPGEGPPDESWVYYMMVGIILGLIIVYALIARWAIIKYFIKEYEPI